MKWNESALISSAFENLLRAGLVYTPTIQTNPAVEQNKNIKWSESPWNQAVLGGENDLCQNRNVTVQQCLENFRKWRFGIFSTCLSKMTEVHVHCLMASKQSQPRTDLPLTDWHGVAVQFSACSFRLWQGVCVCFLNHDQVVCLSASFFALLCISLGCHCLVVSTSAVDCWETLTC